jgi:hypothetical protein
MRLEGSLDAPPELLPLHLYRIIAVSFGSTGPSVGMPDSL